MTEPGRDLRIFALAGAGAAGAAIAARLGVTPGELEEREFEDGEHKARPLDSVRGADVFILADLAGDPVKSPGERLVRLLFFIAACRENGAARITAIASYLPFSRKDRQTKARDPVTTKYVARLFEAVGTDRIVTLDVHNPSAFQNAFRCESIHLDTRRLFVPVIARLAAGRPVTVVSPDPGGVKRAQLLREAYEAETGAPAEFALLEKRRSRGIVSGDLFAGEVDGRAAFVVDDMISTGGTVLRAAEACRERGASAVYALAAHGLFAPAAERLLEPGALDGVVVTDSVAAPARLAGRLAPGRLEIVPLAPLMAGAIACLRGNGSLSDLLGMDR